MWVGSSPTTSEMISARPCAPGLPDSAACASRPPDKSGEVLAHGVDVVDGGAGTQQPLGDLAQLLQRNPVDRRGEQAGTAARNQRQQQVVRPQPARHFQHAQRGGLAAPVGQRVAGFDDLDASGGKSMLVAGDDQALQRRVGRPVGFHRSGHAGGRLAAAHHQGAAARRRGQVRRQDCAGSAAATAARKDPSSRSRGLIGQASLQAPVERRSLRVIPLRSAGPAAWRCGTAPAW
jgi:hypothetical protein